MTAYLVKGGKVLVPEEIAFKNFSILGLRVSFKDKTVLAQRFLLSIFDKLAYFFRNLG